MKIFRKKIVIITKNSEKIAKKVKMGLEKAKDFVLKYKAPIIYSILTVLVLLPFIFEDLLAISLVGVIVCMVFCSLSEQISVIMFLAVFSGKSPIYIASILFCFVTLVIKYIIDAVKKEKPVYRKQLILTLAIVVLFTAVHHEVDVNGFFNWALFVCIICFAYLAFIYYREIDIHKAFKTLIVAIFISAIIGAVAYPLGLDYVYYFDDIVHRLRLFTLNVNHLAMFCTFGIGYVISQIMKKDFAGGDFKFLKDKLFWFRLACVAVLAVIGLLTMSKAFLLVMLLVMVYSLVFIVRKFKVKSLWFALVLVSCIVPLVIIFRSYIGAMLSRFVSYDSWNGLFSKITTGRSELWLMYLKELTSSAWNVIFGVGLLTTDLVSKGPHSVFVYLVYRVGVLGVIMLGVLVYFYIATKKQKFSFSQENILVVLIYFVFALEEMILSDRFFLFLIFGIILMLKGECNGEPNQAENNITIISSALDGKDKSTGKSKLDVENIKNEKTSKNQNF